MCCNKYLCNGQSKKTVSIILNKNAMKFRLIFLLILISVFTKVGAQDITLKQIGKDNLLLRTNLASNSFNFNGNLYTLDNLSSLVRTNLATGEQTQLGNATYKNAKYFFGVNGRLYVIDNDGSMTSIDANSGNWNLVSVIGSWSNIEKVIIIKNLFYSIETGAMFNHPTLKYQVRNQVGKNDFYSMGTVIRGDTSYYSLVPNGALYEINVHTGAWRTISKSKDWKAAKSGAVIGGRLYTVEADDALYETNLADATRKLLDKTQVKRDSYLLSDSGKLYLVNNKGTLFEVTVPL
jgi:hypothetical protein